MKEKIIEWFPLLGEDKDFIITSPKTRAYNCISWATEHDDMWYWPPLGSKPDDDEYWPAELADDTRIETFISAMELEGFRRCPSDDTDTNCTRIALYSKDGDCTHASRQLPNGRWTSKLGFWHDIQHSNPEALEGEIYGSIYCYMKKSLQ